MPRDRTVEFTMLGKLDWSAIPFDQPVPLVAGGVVLVAILAVLVWVVVKGHLPYLWNEWITSVDHKRIGVMAKPLASVMLLRGGSDAIMMRIQQAIAYQAQGYLPPEHYNQIFSAHGTIMIFFVAMPFVIGLMNLARAVATRRARCRLSDAELGRLLADRDLARCWSISRSWSASRGVPVGCLFHRSRS